MEEIPPEMLTGEPTNLVYGATQISFELTPDEFNPEAYTVTEIRTWNRTVLDTVWAELKSGTSQGIKEPLSDPSQYVMTYLRDGYLLVLTFNRDIPVRLVVTQAMTE